MSTRQGPLEDFNRSNQDGARGLAAIKAHGGLTLVEDPATAACRDAGRSHQYDTS